MALRFYGLYRKSQHGEYVRVFKHSAYPLAEASRVWQDIMMMGAMGGGAIHEIRPVPGKENAARRQGVEDYGEDMDGA
jgi:hypothetical protein